MDSLLCEKCHSLMDITDMQIIEGKCYKCDNYLKVAVIC